MTNSEKRIREFGRFRLDVEKKVLWHDGEPVSLPLKEVQLLCVLTDSVGEVVTKDEILNQVWANTFVEESNLSRHIYLLRKTLKDFGETGDLIQTVPRRGYRFAGRVRELQPGELVVEKHSLTRTLIEEVPATPALATLTKSLTPRRRLHALTAAALFVILTVGGVILIERANSRGTRYAVAIPNGATRKSLAIVPFVPISNDITAKNENAVNKLTQAVTERLSSSPEVQLISPEAAAAEKLKIENLLLAGRALQTDAVLTGVVFATEPDIYVRLHLISVNGGEVLWARTYQQPAAELPALLDSIVNDVPLKLQSVRSPDEYDRIARRYTTNREAYQLYLQGRLRFNLRGDVLASGSVFAEDTPMVEPLKQALQLDPNFAMAYVALADLYKAQDYSGPEWKIAEEYCQKAIALDANLAEPHATLGFIRMFQHWDWAGAEAEFKRALELDKNCVTAHQWYALFHALRSNPYEAEREIAQALQLAPYSLSIQSDQGEILYYSGRTSGYGGAIGLLRNVLKQYPGSYNAQSLLINAYWKNGQTDEANQLDAAVHGVPGRNLTPEDRARELAGPRKNSPAFKDLKHPETYNHARWHALLNQREEAIELLEQAFRDHHFFIIYLKADPFFDTLRDEPRFQALLRNTGLE